MVPAIFSSAGMFLHRAPPGPHAATSTRVLQRPQGPLAAPQRCSKLQHPAPPQFPRPPHARQRVPDARGTREVPPPPEPAPTNTLLRRAPRRMTQNLYHLFQCITHPHTSVLAFSLRYVVSHKATFLTTVLYFSLYEISKKYSPRNHFRGT